MRLAQNFQNVLLGCYINNFYALQKINKLKTIEYTYYFMVIYNYSIPHGSIIINYKVIAIYIYIYKTKFFKIYI